VPVLLGELRQADVPAYAAPARPVGTRLREGTEHQESYQLWVGASAYGEAERALMTAMPHLGRDDTLPALLEFADEQTAEEMS
jgi:hypothetical protein